MNLIAVYVMVFCVLVGISENTQNNNDKRSAMDDDNLYVKLVDLQRRHVDWLLEHPDVRAVDINYKTVKGQSTDQLSLVIWVEEKLPENELSSERRLPRHIEGFHTDIIEEDIPVATQVL